ncbi:hypothetical protein [Silvibacterium dinghuense]|uniref:Uncharacterized protein n=1 Tax=Silvibacterium dinghuense TaxID=1560006 RepID=A0A4Q1SIW4_9BACT|nr:hypothetical protein [Silvibacterium dinghuense]RXS97355.1 hypothetical protein ESZ00_05460 [Silvibacterium dinghuense]GGG98291.1 hypothetical protein GCM10011586_12110 [Silvibacterium dinghuense]
MKLSAVVLLLSAGAIASAQTATGTQPAFPAPPVALGTPSQQASEATTERLRKQAQVQVESMLHELDRQAAEHPSCPVLLTSAEFEPYAMPVGSTGQGPGHFNLRYQNHSGKSIASLKLSVQLLVKRSVYDLQAYPLSLTLSAESGSSGELDQLSRLALPTGLHPTTIRNVALIEVTYSDGSTWTSAPSLDGTPACSLQPSPMREVAAR